jgi:IclR family transcriptional regulator, KDG regulon repressor
LPVVRMLPGEAYMEERADRPGRNASQSTDRKFYNKSLERALSLLSAFSFEQQEYTLTELARIQGLPKSTTFRLISTLVDFDFLKFDSSSRCYSLGLKIVELGTIGQRSLSLRKVAFPYMSALQGKLGKTVFLGVLWDDELVYIDRKDDPRDVVRFGSEPGRRRAPYFGMLGQLLMAYLPEHEVDRLLTKSPLAPLTKKSITDKPKFKKRLSAIRERGFVFEQEEVFDGISGIAAPIRNAAGVVAAGLGVGFISSAQDEKGVQKIMQEVRRAALAISDSLGYREQLRAKN